MSEQVLSEEELSGFLATALQGDFVLAVHAGPDGRLHPAILALNPTVTPQTLPGVLRLIADHIEAIP